MKIVRPRGLGSRSVNQNRSDPIRNEHDNRAVIPENRIFDRTIDRAERSQPSSFERIVKDYDHARNFGFISQLRLANRR